MPTISEIAPDTYRISVFSPDINIQFNHFLIRDEQPLLVHAGYRAMFPQIREAVATLIDPKRIRWVGFSHFESDECGGLNHWLAEAPAAQPVCSFVGAAVSVNDFATRPAKGMQHGEILETGKYRFRFCSTAHLPHGWDAGVFFEETNKTLLCSDLFFQDGDVEPITEKDVLGRARKALIDSQAGPLGNSVPYTPMTETILHGLASLKPRTLAAMHGSTYVGNGAAALRGLAVVLKETFSKPSGESVRKPAPTLND